jgi:serine protease
MRLSIVLIALISVAFAISPQPIPGRYIFVYHSNSTLAERHRYQEQFLASSGSHIIRRVYSFGTFHGFSAETNEQFIRMQKDHPLIKHVEQDYVVHASQAQCQTQTGATWGINRVSERALKLNGEYNYEYDGTTVDAYIIDTGIFLTHSDFGGRAIFGANFVDGNNADCNGHGTHVAGTVGGTQWGIAKKVTLIAVKVLNCAGSGSYEGVISGIQWTVQNQQKTKKKSVANMSLGGPLYQPVNDAVDAAVNAGIGYVIAAGNNNQDACYYSPASSTNGISVGSTEVYSSGNAQLDARSIFSNYGTCVDIFAPGTMVTSAWNDGTTRTISGTSMAAPHVCGAAALYFDEYPNATPVDLRTYLSDQSTKNIIDLECTNPTCQASPNYMLYSACDFSN